MNAEIRWSTKFHEKEWNNLTVDEILQKKSARIILEFVANLNIKFGEEILIDYGDDWNDAWEEHIASWQPIHSGHVPIHHMNMEKQIRYAVNYLFRKSEINGTIEM